MAIDRPTQVYRESVSVPLALLNVETSPLAFRVWIALAKFVDRQHVCWPSNGRLLELLPAGTTLRSLQRAKAELEGLNLLRREPRHDASGRETSCRYLLTYPAVDDHSVGEDVSTDRGEDVQADTPGDVQADTPGSSLIGSSLRRKEPTAVGEEASPQQQAALTLQDPPTNGQPLDVDSLAALWNAEAPKGLPRVKDVSDGRRKKARASLRQFPHREWWQQVMREYRASSFLQGLKNGRDHEHFKADFDWLMAKSRDGTENAVRVHEGRYRDGVEAEAPYGGKFG